MNKTTQIINLNLTELLNESTLNTEFNSPTRALSALLYNNSTSLYDNIKPQMGGNSKINNAHNLNVFSATSSYNTEQQYMSSSLNALLYNTNYQSGGSFDNSFKQAQLSKPLQTIKLDLSLLNDLTDTHTYDVSLPLSGLLYNDSHDHYGGNFLGDMAKKLATSVGTSVAKTASTAAKGAATDFAKDALTRGRDLSVSPIKLGKKTFGNLRRSISPTLERGKETLGNLRRSISPTLERGIQRGKKAFVKVRQAAEQSDPEQSDPEQSDPEQSEQSDPEQSEQPDPEQSEQPDTYKDTTANKSDPRKLVGKASESATSPEEFEPNNRPHKTQSHTKKRPSLQMAVNVPESTTSPKEFEPNDRRRKTQSHTKKRPSLQRADNVPESDTYPEQPDLEQVSKLKEQVSKLERYLINVKNELNKLKI